MQQKGKRPMNIDSLKCHHGNMDVPCKECVEEDREHMEEAGREWADDTIVDGFGSAWSRCCPMCGRDSMVVVRPGKCQCSLCCSTIERQKTDDS